jgi:hypothetical protein
VGFFDDTLDRIRRLVVSYPAEGDGLIGDTLPRNPLPYIPAFDGRTAALRALRQYVCALQFFRENEAGKPSIPFRIRPENFHIDYPDNESSVDFSAGTIVVVPSGRFRYEDNGGYPDEASRDQHGRGTYLYVKGTYEEDFDLEYRCALKQQRRAWKGGMEIACSPVEALYAVLRLRTEGYYGQNATFVLSDGMLLDNADEARGRRTVRLGFQLRLQIVQLVSDATLTPQIGANVDVDEATGVAVNLPDGNPTPT